MDFFLTIICSITLIISIACLIYSIKLSRNAQSAISESDLKRIRESVNESIESMSRIVSEMISEKNSKSFESISDKMNELDKMMKYSMDSINDLEKKQSDFLKEFEDRNRKSKEELIEKVEKSIISLNDDVSKNLDDIRKDNSEKLDKISLSVNEKLEKTLEDKLKDSFENVIRSIGNVNTAIGEIKGLASDVGSLKNVLTNVKSKGIIGEIMLGNIIREFLTPTQFDENVITKKGSSERVEFAIKLPGHGDNTVYLPIDSKFPYESYSRILESDDIEEIKESRKLLRQNLLKYAKEVSEKYIDVPNTTDFAVIFLPLEGLYLEALNLGLFEEIQSKYKVNLTGPTTLTAFINALEVGFKSLAIEKKSADVFKLLGAVKMEFSKFAEALEKTQKKMDDATRELDDLVGKRTRQMNSKLKSIDTIDESEVSDILGENEK